MFWPWSCGSAVWPWPPPYYCPRSEPWPRTKRKFLFERIESRFSLQAKVTTLLTGLSGFYMLHVLDAWSRYAEPRFWWIHAMTLVWVIFTLILFVIEPLLMHR